MKKKKVKEDDDVAEVPHTHTKTELAKLQAAHMLLQGQLLQARAEEAATLAAKEWLCQQKHSNTKVRKQACFYNTSMLQHHCPYGAGEGLSVTSTVSMGLG